MASPIQRTPHLLGKMRHRIDVYTVVRTPDAIGGYTRADTLLGTYWANVITISATELWKFEQIDKRVSHVIYMRFQSGIERGQKVVWGAKELYIVGVVNMENRNRYLEVTVTEGQTE